MDKVKTTLTVGYHPQKGAQTFELKPGEKLPAGWSDKPHKGQHPHDDEREPEQADETQQSRR